VQSSGVATGFCSNAVCHKLPLPINNGREHDCVDYRVLVAAPRELAVVTRVMLDRCDSPSFQFMSELLLTCVCVCVCVCVKSCKYSAATCNYHGTASYTGSCSCMLSRSLGHGMTHGLRRPNGVYGVYL
jgi:hypothetical protein